MWTYHLDDVWTGIQDAYADLARNTLETCGEPLARLEAVGVSAMMHGYLPFDAAGNQLAPFRTWRNTMTAKAAEELTALFSFNIPQRWSIAHLYQAILNGEEHVKDIAFLTTLAGYVHWKLTGVKALGVGDASGMFPIDSGTGDYDAGMLAAFDAKIAAKGYPWKLRDILPEVLGAGEDAGRLTEAGARGCWDPTGALEAGAPLCPPEGDAGTGMAATNSVAERTGQRIGGHVGLCHGGAGKAAEQGLSRNRHGHHPHRAARGHGALQQLHQRHQRLGRGALRLCAGGGAFDEQGRRVHHAV